MPAGLGLLLAASVPAQSFVVDFARAGGPPLVKDKFGVYATPFTPVDELVRGLPMLRELNVRDFRYEIAWGKPDAVAFDQISGTPAEPKVDFRPLDAMLDGLATQGVRPLLAMSYCPVPLKTRTPWDAWKDVPSDLGSWQKIHALYGAHFSTRPAPRPFYEVWNEPDMPEGPAGSGQKMFFNGTAEDYLRVYDASRAGLRAGDPESEIGGPAAAYDLAYLRPLLTRPLEFASIHGYANYPAQLDGMRAALKDHPGLPIFLTEYASFNSFALDGPSTKAEAAARFFADVPGLLRYGDVPKIYWAQWIDDVLGLVGRDGKRRALFNAFTLYGMMPIDRARVTPETDAGVTAFASAGPEGAAVALTNPGETDRKVTLDLRNLPKGLREIELLRVDPGHASVRDDPTTERLRVDERFPIAPRWTGTVPRHGVVLLRMSPGRIPSPSATPKADLARLVYHYDDRISGAQAHFDPVGMTARLSLEGRGDATITTATARIGAVLMGMPKRFRVRRTGSDRANLEIAFVGTTVKRAIALGRNPVASVDLARLAPGDWDGRRVELSFALTGETGDRAKIELLR